MNALIAALRHLPKRTSTLVAIAAAVVIVPAIGLAWGPTDRPTYTVDEPADHITFNSITDNPDYGDERNFVRIKDAANTAAGGWSDTITVQPGREYLVQMYVHNNAATTRNLTATNTTVKANVPTTTGKSVQIDGFISADNAQPKQIWDQVVLNSASSFNLAYVSGSAVYYNKANPKGTALGNSIVTNTGVKVGYKEMDGKVPGCFQYSGYVSFKIKPQFAPTSNFTVSKQVSKHDANKWSKNYAATPGEKVDYLIQYKNTGDVQHDNVTLVDKLPAGASYVAGSTTLGNTLHPTGIATNNGITSTGLNIGSYAKGGGAWVIFSATVAASKDLPCGPNTLKNIVNVVTDYGTKSDSANVTVNGATCAPKECKPGIPVGDVRCNPPVASYKCDALAVATTSRTTFTFSTAYTVQSATFKNVTYVVRDSAGKEIYRGTNANYTQTKTGKYTVEAIVTVTVNGVDKTAPTAGCKKPFEVVEKNQPCVVPGKEHLPANSPDCKEAPKEFCTVPGKTTLPKNSPDCKEDTTVVPPELPQTGIGDNIVALLGAGSLVAAAAYYVASRRATN